MEYRNNDKIEGNIYLFGMVLFILAIIVGCVLSFVFKPILRVRYLMPAVGVFWFAISVLIGKTKNNKLLIISLVLILILGSFNMYGVIDSINSAYADGINNANVLDGINQDNSTVICIGAGEVIQFGTYFNDSNVYMDGKEVYGVSDRDLEDLFDIKYSSNLNKTIDKNKDDDIYIVMGNWRESDLVDENNSMYNIELNYFYKYS